MLNACVFTIATDSKKSAPEDLARREIQNAGLRRQRNLGAEIEDFWEIFGHLWEGQEIATIPAEQGSQDGQTMEKDL